MEQKKRILRLHVVVAFAAAAAVACTPSGGKQGKTETDTIPNTPAECAPPGGRCRRVAPLPPRADLGNLTNDTLAAAFTVDDFDWSARTLKLEVYSADRYDAAAVEGLVAGDTIVYDGNACVVDSVEVDSVKVYDIEDKGTARFVKSVSVYVNGNPDDGAQLVKSDDGTYYFTQVENGYELYTKVGTVTLPLSDDLTVSDGYGNESPLDSPKTVTAGVRQYLEGPEDISREFGPINTEVMLRDGKVARIERCWIA